MKRFVFLLVLSALLVTGCSKSPRELAGCDAPTTKDIVKKLVSKQLLSDFQTVIFLAKLNPTNDKELSPAALKKMKSIISDPKNYIIQHVYYDKSDDKNGVYLCEATVSIRSPLNHKIIEAADITYSSHLSADKEEVMVNLYDFDDKLFQ